LPENIVPNMHTPRIPHTWQKTQFLICLLHKSHIHARKHARNKVHGRERISVNSVGFREHGTWYGKDGSKQYMMQGTWNRVH